ncbi:MAG TPA: chemotaxis protein CheW [Clostridia bacterium]|nr:chemotaxis protein CheW [Clostridia bacterium]
MDEIKQIVIFKLDNVQYGFPIGQINEIINFVAPIEIPDVPDYIEGLISLREKVYTVISLRNFLGMGKSPADGNTKIMIATAGRVGFLVDEVSMIVAPKEEEVDVADDLPVYIDKDYLLYILKIDGEITIVLNMHGILDTNARAEEAV